MLRISKLALGIHPQAFVDRTRLLGVRIRMLRISKHPLGDLEKPMCVSVLFENPRTPASTLASGSVDGSSPSPTTAVDLVPDHPEQLILEIGSKSEGLDVRSSLDHRRPIDRIDVLQGRGSGPARVDPGVCDAVDSSGSGLGQDGRSSDFEGTAGTPTNDVSGFGGADPGPRPAFGTAVPEGGGVSIRRVVSIRFSKDSPPSLGTNFEGRRRSCPVPGRSQALRRTGRWTSASTEVNMETA